MNSLAALPGSPEISITTNVLRLPVLAQPLKDAGLARFNVSLDTLNRKRYRALLRTNGTDEDIARMLGLSVATKAAGHGISSSEFTPPARSMSAIGG